MLTQDRYRAILDLLEEKNSVTVSELTKLLDSSESTIRRDLSALDEMGKLTKVFGGATSITRNEGVFEDAVIGADVKIGAGTITCNYDGVNKFTTRIANGAFIGSGTMLVAPVVVEENATIGAGSGISKTAPADALTVARSKAITLTDWKRPQKLKDIK